MTETARATMPMTVADLAERIWQSRMAFDAAVARLTPEQFLTPGADGWSAKDTLAHVTSWEQSATAMMLGEPRFASMGITGDAATMDIDAINLQLVDLHRDRPAAEVVAMARESHARLLGALATLSDEDLRRPYRDARVGDGPDGDEAIVAWFAGDTYEHYDEHLPSLRERVNGA